MFSVVLKPTFSLQPSVENVMALLKAPFNNPLLVFCKLLAKADVDSLTAKSHLPSAAAGYTVITYFEYDIHLVYKKELMPITRTSKMFYFYCRTASACFVVQPTWLTTLIGDLTDGNELENDDDDDVVICQAALPTGLLRYLSNYHMHRTCTLHHHHMYDACTSHVYLNYIQCLPHLHVMSAHLQSMFAPS